MACAISCPHQSSPDRDPVAALKWIGLFHSMFFLTPSILNFRSPCYTFNSILDQHRRTTHRAQRRAPYNLFRYTSYPSNTALLRYDAARPVAGSTEFVFYNSSLDSLTAHRLLVLSPCLRINSPRLASSKVRQPWPPLFSLHLRSRVLYDSRPTNRL
jgi:hypothetical protein